MAEPTENKKQNALSISIVILGWVAMLIFAFHASTHQVKAGDTWVAMACGRHITNHGVNTVEPFSANSHNAGPTQEEIKTWPEWAQWITEKVGLETATYWHPTGWVNQNWLTHVIFYWLTHKSPFADADTFSFNTLVYWKFAICILAVICVYFTGRLLGAHPALSAASACFALFVGRTFLDIRPAVFSNLLVAVFLLILALTTYRNILYIWLLVPLAVFWCNVHGGYIYAFIMLAPFVVFSILTSLFPKQFSSMGPKGVRHTVGAGFAALMAVILFNPFRLTNLTHVLVIAFSKHAEMWRRVLEWHPAFEWKNPVGSAVPFLVLLILAGVLLALWLFSRFLKPGFMKINLPLMVIAALTIYMAVNSRRFIPIAAIATCPILAMLAHQILRALRKPLPYILKFSLTLAGLVFILAFSISGALKFKSVYLDPWPRDQKYNSMFMRMTLSDSKPFAACRFINDNKLEGNIFSFWTEGGFIAWSQTPDPETGKTPVQLFIDGRAQAAYEPRIFKLYSNTMLGGPTGYTAARKKRKLTAKDYTEIGSWLDKQLKTYDTSVALMPSSEFKKPFVKGLERNPNWSLVYIDNEQKVFIDKTTIQGEELIEGIFNGKTLYPDNFSKNLILAHYMFMQSQSKENDENKRLEFATKGLRSAILAFQLDPSPVPMTQVIWAARFAELRPQVNDLCEKYIAHLRKNKHYFERQSGHINRAAAAATAAGYLQKIAQKEKNIKAAQTYLTIKSEYRSQIRKLSKKIRW
jgi:hypothetical protein